METGRAIARDVLEAQEAKIEAENALIGALVDHTVAVLEFERDIEMLEVDEWGQWREGILSDE